MQEKQPRKPRCDRGQIQVTERDLWVLRWIGEQYAVRLDHLQELLGRKQGEEQSKRDRSVKVQLDWWWLGGLAQTWPPGRSSWSTNPSGSG
jgi:hypothetical protein